VKKVSSYALSGLRIFSLVRERLHYFLGGHWGRWGQRGHWGRANLKTMINDSIEDNSLFKRERFFFSFPASH
jgi:hypothetical protein